MANQTEANSGMDEAMAALRRFIEEGKCFSKEVILSLKDLMGPAFAQFNSTLHEQNLTCAGTNQTPMTILLTPQQSAVTLSDAAAKFYAYVTPIIFIIGVIGNSLSLRVFLSKPMRKMSACYYLAALAASDIGVLFTYLLLEWLNKGLPVWPGGHRVQIINHNGVCQTFLFLSYSFRFLSVWLIVIFTIERYIGVCMPLKRRGRCTATFARRAIGTVAVLSLLVSSFKPALTTVNPLRDGQTYCGARIGYIRMSFIFDAVYSLCITAVPFIVITSLNLLITRKLWQTRKRHKQSRFLTEENFVKLEFTFLLLVISTFFIALSLPYFVVWCIVYASNFRHLFDATFVVTASTRLSGLIRITRTIFYLNFCVNFFLYSLTGAHFRRRLVAVLRPKRPNRPRSFWDLFETRNASHISYNESTLAYRSGRDFAPRASRTSTCNKTQVTTFSASLRSTHVNAIKEEFL